MNRHPARAILLLVAAAACSRTESVPSDIEWECGGPPPGTWYEDYDRDGLGGDTQFRACVADPEWVTATGDCDDYDATIGAPPTWYLDEDGDGHAGSATTVAACEAPAGHHAEPTDCDDADRAVYPGAPPICGDGIVNDCDGPPDPETGCRFEGEHDVANARHRWTGGHGGDMAGDAVGAADIDGDGRKELLVSAHNESVDGFRTSGAVHLLDPSSAPGDVRQAALASYRGAERTHLGPGTGVGDLNGDGREDLLIGSYLWTFLVTDAIPGEQTINGVATGDFELASGDGMYVGVPDTDGNGTPGVAFGGYDDDNIGRVYLFQMPIDGLYDGVDAWATIQAPAEGLHGVGYALAGGDFDGDGMTEVVYTARSTVTPCGVGRAAWIADVPPGGIHVADEVATTKIYECHEALGTTVVNAGDVNGDGYEDLHIGSSSTVSSSEDDRVVAGFLLSGPIPAGEHAAAEIATARWHSTVRRAGDSAAAGGDLDGDGFDDVVIQGVEEETPHYGRAYVFYGPVAGTLDLSTDRDVELYDGSSSYLGQSMRFVGDVDADGRDDLLLGAPNWGSTGAAYLVLGGQVF